ncbi:MAG: hypothetical protein ABR591_11810 [Candidatus Velthaea sp.]
MRYGIGQLADYGFRYKSVLGDAQKVLAFGRRPARETTWIGDVLDEQHIALVAAESASRPVLALNETARSLAWID